MPGKTKPKHYFVSYNFIKGLNKGYGNVTLTLTKPFNIKEVIVIIENKYNIKEVIITFYREVKDEYGRI